MSDAADISVVVPAFNAAETIERALASIAAQTLQPREVIVVDDGSDDATLQVLAAYQGLPDGTSLTVLSQNRAGAGAARNRAVAAATGEYIAFLDADDDWLPGHLEAGMKLLAAGGYTVVAHNEWIVEDGIERLNDSARRVRERADPFVAIYCKGCISTSTVVTRRAAVQAAGGFDPDLVNGQDVDLWLAMLRGADASFAIAEEPLGRYYLRAGSINTHTARRFRFFLKIARRWSRDVALRPHGGLGPLAFRMAAVHYGALQGFMAAGQWLRAMGVCLRLPIELLMTLRYRFAAPVYVRPDFLAGLANGREAETTS
jgi:glycosyltransferase involved in cell wall biosynthesis